MKTFPMSIHAPEVRRAGQSLVCGLLALNLLATPTATLRASDHADLPQLGSLMRNDGRITDLHAFTRHNRLVLILCVNPAVPGNVVTYNFSSDLTLRFHIDNHTPVSFDNAADYTAYGGTILEPAKISEDVLIEFTFDRAGEPIMQAEGIPAAALKDAQLFTGLRDDPFIRGPRIGRNVGAVVLELPLEAVLKDQSTLLIWATSKVPEIKGPIADHAGRSLRSMFPEGDAMNSLRPRDQITEMGVQPDVIILDVSRPSGYPNGRLLEDDILDMINDPRVMWNDQPFPEANDKPFLDTFPYLAEPHAP